MKTFYQLDSTRVTFREYAFGSPWLLMPVIALIKLLRIPVPSSSDDPPVASLAPFEVDETVLPAEVRGRFEPLTRELAALGFGRPIYHQIYDPLHFTYIYWATFLHTTGRAVARIHHRVWSHPSAHKSYLFPVFISEMADESFLVSSAGKPDFIAPESIRVHYQTGATATELWEFHDRRLDDLLPRQAVSVNSHDRLRDLIERHHGALRDFHLARGVFKPLSEAKQEALAAQSEVTLATTTGTSVEEAVLARLDRSQTEKPSWWNSLVILGISLLLFAGAGRMDVSWQFLWVLLPVLFLHELGHYLAMRVFGYRKLRMFFIPFFGAAVMGKHYNVSGSKKAIVALAGPVPGIVVGAGLGVAGLVWNQSKLIDLALLMMILNGFNLLPLMPFDGGWVLHAVVFCRHPLLDLAFRLLAVLGIFALGLLTGSRLYLVAVLLLIGLPAAWRVAQVAHRLRRRGALALSPDDVSIPPETAKTILAELGAGRHNRLPANVLAQQVTSVFGTLNARPPGVLASIALLAAHGGSFLAALVLSVVFVLGRQGGFRDRHAPARDPTPHVYTPGTTREWRGPAAPAIPPPSATTLLATYSDEESARAQFTALPKELPRGTALCLFGQSLLLTLPDNRGETQNQWVDRLWQQAEDVVIGHKDTPAHVSLSCVSPSEAEAERLEAELRDYLQFPDNWMLLAPWSAAWKALPEEDRQRFQKARRTLGRLELISEQALQHPEVQAQAERLASIMLSRNQVDNREVAEAFERARQAEEQRLLAAIVAEGEKTVDHTMLELWQRRLKLMKALVEMKDDRDDAAQEAEGTAWQRQSNALNREMAQRMGPLPLVGDRPRPGSDLETAGGRVTRKGLSVTIEGVVFQQIGKGLPALAEWLCQRDCSQIRYGFKVMEFDP